MEEFEIYTEEQVKHFVELYLSEAERDKLDPILDSCANIYDKFNVDEQIKFKSAAKGFVRTYGFLGAILEYGNIEWEKLSIFLNLLIPKLPSPEDVDLSAGILEAIDLDSYRAEVMAQRSIILNDADAEVDPVPTDSAGAVRDAELDYLTSILQSFNDLWGNIKWNNDDNVKRQIALLPAMVSKDKTYQNAMRNADEQEARTESDKVLQRIIFEIMSDNMELFKLFTDNPEFKNWLSDKIFFATYNKDGKPIESGESATIL